MKFFISFKLHSSEFNTGYRYILSFPGLVRFSAVHSMLKCTPLYTGAGNPVYISSDYLVSNGWNSIELEGDGVYIKLRVNGNVFTVLDSTVYREVFDYYVSGTVSITNRYIVSNFSTSNFIYAKEWPNIHNARHWSIGVRTDFGNPPDEGYYGPLCGSSAPFDQRFRYPFIGTQGAGSNLYAHISFDGSNWGIAGGFYPGLSYTRGQWTDVIFEYDDGYYKVGKKLPEETNYTYGSNVVYGSAAYQATSGNYQIGSTWGDRSAGATKFDIRGCFIEADGVKYSSKKEYINPYPTLYVGNLKLYGNSWLVLKDIEALKLED